MEIPNSHLAQIFVKYFNKEVAIVSSPKNELQKQKVSCSNLSIIEYLELRPLSAITDEHAIECLNLMLATEGNSFKDWNPKEQQKWLKLLRLELSEGGVNFVIRPYFTHVLQIYQYLHALGYALQITLLDENNKPVTYSVEQLVEAGVYKLI